MKKEMKAEKKAEKKRLKKEKKTESKAACINRAGLSMIGNEQVAPPSKHHDKRRGGEVF